MKLTAADADGYIRQDLVLSATTQLAAGSTGDTLRFQTRSCGNDPRIFEGKALVIGERGLSVIADVDSLPESDDARFEKWKADGAVFHYLSASPWQWFGLVSQKLQTRRLPPGVLQLNTLPLADITSSPESLLAHVVMLVNPSTAFKGPAIESLLQRFPERRFILVGHDENDAALFADLKEKYPKQIQENDR